MQAKNETNGSHFNYLLAFAWTVMGSFLITAILGMSNVFNPLFILPAAILLAPMAFVAMLIADKV